MNPFESKKSIRQHLLDLTKELVRFPSHSDEPEKILLLTQFITAYFEQEKVVIKEHSRSGIPSLVICTEDTKHPDLLLSGHIDVVPSSNRYIALEEGPLLYGSGALDMKGGVAVMMALLKYFSRQEKVPSLGLMITADEEVGSYNGTKYLLGDENYRANFVIINEGRRQYDLVTREKGIMVLKFISIGTSMHSAYPWRGENALENLMRFLLKLTKIFPKPADKWTTTAGVTVLRAGLETNTIPGQAEATVNIRLTGGKHWSKERVLEKITALLPKSITIADMSYGDVFLADPKDPSILLLKKAATEVLGKPIKFGENHGASDAKVFQNYHIPTAVLGPVGVDHHSPQEALEIESLPTHFEVLKRFVELYEADKKKLQSALLKK